MEREDGKSGRKKKRKKRIRTSHTRGRRGEGKGGGRKRIENIFIEEEKEGSNDRR